MATQIETLDALVEALNSDAELLANQYVRGMPAGKRLAPIVDQEKWSRTPTVLCMPCVPDPDPEGEDYCEDTWRQILWVAYSEGIETVGEVDDAASIAEVEGMINWMEALARRINRLEIPGIGRPVELAFATEGHPLFNFWLFYNHRLFVSILRVTYSERE